MRLKDLSNIKRTNTTVVGLLNASSKDITGIQRDTKGMMEALAETINIELAEINDEIEEN